MLRTQLHLLLSVGMAKLRPTNDLLACSTCHFLVKPWDLDLNFHLNNVRGSEYLARALSWHFVRTRYIGMLYFAGYRTFIATTHLSYIQPLAALQRFSIETQLTGCDAKYTYFEQTISSGTRPAVISVQRMSIVDRDRRPASPEAVLRELTARAPLPPAPPYASALRDFTRAHRAPRATAPNQDLPPGHP